MRMKLRNLSSRFATSLAATFELENLNFDHPFMKFDHVALNSDMHYAKSKMKTSRFDIFALIFAKFDMVPATLDQIHAKSELQAIKSG